MTELNPNMHRVSKTACSSNLIDVRENLTVRDFCSSLASVAHSQIHNRYADPLYHYPENHWNHPERRYCWLEHPYCHAYYQLERHRNAPEGFGHVRGTGDYDRACDGESPVQPSSQKKTCDRDVHESFGHVREVVYHGNGHGCALGGASSARPSSQRKTTRILHVQLDGPGYLLQGRWASMTPSRHQQSQRHMH